jgi:hypothetical protein
MGIVFFCNKIPVAKVIKNISLTNYFGKIISFIQNIVKIYHFCIEAKNKRITLLYGLSAHLTIRLCHLSHLSRNVNTLSSNSFFSNCGPPCPAPFIKLSCTLSAPITFAKSFENCIDISVGTVPSSVPCAMKYATEKGYCFFKSIQKYA